MPLNLRSLLQRGYFPRELPPPFNTRSYGRFASAAADPFPFNRSLPSKIEIFNLARSGTLRRQLSILNPVSFFRLAEFVSKKWADLEHHTSPSPFSLTLPKLGRDGRAIGRRYSLDVLPEKRAKLRSRGKYVLRADINRFYPSIYTHSLAWATEGKTWAKNPANRKVSCLGNDLDRLLQRCQDGQTNGIPIGPDTSLLVAEILLSKVDQVLAAKGFQGIRYIDDYEFAFDTEAAAVDALSIIQQELVNFELHLNSTKSGVSPLPQNLQDGWVTVLKAMPLDASHPQFKRQLIRFFDHAFALSVEKKSEGFLKYAVGRIANLRSVSEPELMEDLLIQAARVETGALPIVLEIILVKLSGLSRRKGRRREMLIKIIIENAPQRHSSEVAWALWGCLALKIKVPREVITAVLSMEDSVCALLTLHARDLDLVSHPRELDSLVVNAVGHQLYDTRWMLSYEANVKGWLTAPADHVLADQNFRSLKSAGVSFYDSSKTSFPVRRGGLQTPHVFASGDYPDDEDGAVGEPYDAYENEQQE